MDGRETREESQRRAVESGFGADSAGKEDSEEVFSTRGSPKGTPVTRFWRSMVGQRGGMHMHRVPRPPLAMEMRCNLMQDV